MKPFSKTANKWVLSTLMIAALGSQYYFSVSSKSYGQFELSSTAGEELGEQLKQLQSASSTMNPEEYAKKRKELLIKFAPLIKAENDALSKATVVKVVPAKAEASAKPELKQEAKPEVADSTSGDVDPNFMGPPAPADLKKSQPETITVKADGAKVVSAVSTSVATTAAAAPVAAPEAPKKSETEGKTYKIICQTCNKDGYVVISKANEQIALQMAAVLNAKADAQPTAPATPEAKPAATVAKADEHADETPAERSRRLREEKREAKEEKRLAKEEAEREKKEERNEAFADKASEISERCNDDLGCKMSRFTSLMRSFTGRKKVDQFAVTKAYNELIAGDLKGALTGADGSASKTAALEAIGSMMSSVPSEYKFLKKNSIDSVKYGQIAQAASVETLYKQADQFKAQRRTTEELQTRDQAMRADQAFRQDANSVYSTLRESLGSVNDTATWNYVTTSYVPDLQTAINKFTGLSGFSVNGTSSVSSSVNESTSSGRGGRNGNATISNGSAITDSSNGLSGVNFGTPGANRSVNRTGVNFK
jgi:hypothetical protein